MTKITNRQAMYYGYSIFVISLFLGNYIIHTYKDTWIDEPIQLMICVHGACGLIACFLGVIGVFKNEE